MPASPSTTASAAELRQDLGVVAYEQLGQASARGHIGVQVMPPFMAGSGAAQFPAVDKSQGRRPSDDARGPSGNYNEVDWAFKMLSFETVDRGLEGRVDDRLVALYGRLLPVEDITTRTTVNRMLLNHDRRVAAQLASTGGTHNVSVPWSTPATATPHADVQAGKAAFRLQSGLLPNMIALSLTAFWAALATAEIKDALKYTNPIEMGGMDAQKRALAMFFGVDELAVAGGVQDTSKKGQTAVLSDIWGTDVHLLHVSPGGQDVMEPAYGRTVLWTGQAGSAAGDGEGMLIVETYRDEARRSDMVRVRYDVSEFVQYSDAHYKLTGITA